MENIVEPEIYNQGEATVVCFPFLQDPKFVVDKVNAGDRKIHSGEPLTLKLNEYFNAEIVFQPSEATDQPFKLDAWNRECDILVGGGLARDVARRVVLRKRFPLIVQVEDGVVYSPTQKVVCESLGKIVVMRQQLIPVPQVFLTSPPPTQVYRNAEAAKAAVQQGFPSSGTAPPSFINSQDDLMMTAGFGPDSMTQAKPLTRIPRQSSEPVAGPSRQLSQQPAKRQCLNGSGVAQVPVSRADMMNAVETIHQFFNANLMDLFNIPGDRAAKNIPETKPDPRTVMYSFGQFHAKDGLHETNTTKMGSYLFGEGKKNCNLFIYKTKNKFTGHNVPISIREGGSILKMLVLAMMEAMQKVAANTLELEKKEVATLEESAKQAAVAAAEERYAEKMARLN